MANYIDIDSLYRDRETYPNPADFTIRPSDTLTWYPLRVISRNPPDTKLAAQNLFQSISLLSLIIPYHDEFADLPKLYVDMHCLKYQDTPMIYTIDNKLSTARFVCVPEKIQNDSSGTPVWIHFKGITKDQTFRFYSNETIVFKVFTRTNTVLPLSDPVVDPVSNEVLPLDPNLQVLATFEVVPYLRDGDYAQGIGNYLLNNNSH
jgi:hypothetical protein